MEIIASAVQAFFSFKAYVMFPILIFLIALSSGMGARLAGFSALKVGAGFAGIFIVFGFFVSKIGPAVRAIASVRGIDYPVMDVGWPPLAAITWAWAWTPLTILAVAGLNALMVALKMTRLLYIDLWNYWHFAFMGALFQAVGAAPLISFLSVLSIAALNFKLTEWSSAFVERETGLEGVGISPLSVAGLLPWAVLLDKLIDRVPGLRRLSFNPAKRTAQKASLLAEPMVIGFGVGLFLGVLAGYRLKDILEVAVEISAVMFILPRCGAAIGEAMGEISAALRKRLEPWLGGGRFAIALDTGVILGNPSIITTGLLLMPLSLLLAFILPGNKLIPLGDLPNLISIFSLLVVAMRGNVFRAVLAGLPAVAAFMLIAGELAPLFTRLAAGTGMDFGAGGALITAFTDGGNPIRWWFLQLREAKAGAMILIFPAGFALWLAWREQRRCREELDRRRSGGGPTEDRS